MVGGASTVATPENVTTPTWKVSGRSVMNSAAATRAASRRVGSTSVASMDLETSIATMTVARSCGTRISTSGRAAATVNPASATTSSAAGR